MRMLQGTTTSIGAAGLSDVCRPDGLGSLSSPIGHIECPCEGASAHALKDRKEEPREAERLASAILDELICMLFGAHGWMRCAPEGSGGDGVEAVG